MFDKDTLKPSLLVLALALVMSVLLPWINSQASYRHPIGTGDVAVLASGITLTPAVGWDLSSGALLGHVRTQVGSTASTELVDGSVRFAVQAAPFAGNARELLMRVREISSALNHTRASARATPTYPVRTRQGAVGVGQDFVGVDRQGSVVAFVFRLRGQRITEGVEVVVSGTKGQISRARDTIVAMIRSIREGS